MCSGSGLEPTGATGATVERSNWKPATKVKRLTINIFSLSSSLFFLFIILCNWIAGFIFPLPCLCGIKLKIGTAGIG